MKSTKLKILFAGISIFAVTSIFAQDSPSTPKPDTSKAPKPDSTSMVILSRNNNLLRNNVYAMTSLQATNVNNFVAKKEAENEILSQKSSVKISA
ncbi:MAG: hypothetical protein ABI472_06780 [Ginsengibacter sp.]